MTVDDSWDFLDTIYPVNVVTGHRELHLLPLWFEEMVGSALYPAYKIQSGGVVSQKYKQYENLVQKVGEQLAAHSPRKGLDFEFAVVNDWTLNAWCLPGGKIAVNIGILHAMEREIRNFGLPPMTLEEKVAALLSHEITHATARHYGRAMEFRLFIAGAIKAASYGISYLIEKYHTGTKKEQEQTLQKTQRIFNVFVKLAASGLGKCSSRAHELEADKYGMVLLHKAGKDAQSAIWLQHFFLAQNPKWSFTWFEWLSSFTSTHPSSTERLEANQRTYEQLQHTSNSLGVLLSC